MTLGHGWLINAVNEESQGASPFGDPNYRYVHSDLLYKFVPAGLAAVDYYQHERPARAAVKVVPLDPEEREWM